MQARRIPVPVIHLLTAGNWAHWLGRPTGTTVVMERVVEHWKMMQGALVVLSAVILGLQLSFKPMKGFWKLIMVSILIQMLFQPWFSDFASGLLSVSAQNRQILILLSAMPAAILGPVFAARYDCAAKTATLLAFTHIAISPVVVPAVFAIFT